MQRGFTLLELLITLTVLVVFLTAAVPSYRTLIASQSMVAQSNAFVSFLTSARSEAITRSQSVRACKSADETACTVDGGWEQGGIAYVDTNDDGARNASSEPIVDVLSALERATLTGGDDATANSIRFGPHGFAVGSSGELQLARDDTDDVNRICVSPSGAISLHEAGGACL
ncbi:MAG: GspH/FimT family protein [Salinisphaeraceae bacterium]